MNYMLYPTNQKQIPFNFGHQGNEYATQVNFHRQDQKKNEFINITGHWEKK